MPKIAELIILEKLERRQMLCPSDQNSPNSVLPTTNFAVGYFSFSSKSSCNVVGLIQVVFCPLINKLFGLTAPLSWVKEEEKKEKWNLQYTSRLRPLDSKTSTTRSTRFLQYQVMLASEPASFWRVKVVAVVIPVRVLARMSYWRKQVIKCLTV